MERFKLIWGGNVYILIRQCIYILFKEYIASNSLSLYIALYIKVIDIGNKVIIAIGLKF